MVLVYLVSSDLYLPTVSGLGWCFLVIESYLSVNPDSPNRISRSMLLGGPKNFGLPDYSMLVTFVSNPDCIYYRINI